MHAETSSATRLPAGHSNRVINMCHRAGLAPSRAAVLRHFAARFDFRTWTTHPAYRIAVASVATDAEVCDRTVHYALTDLIEEGILSKVSRPGRTSLYTLHVARLEQLVEQADTRRKRASAARSARNAGKVPIGRPGEQGDEDYERPLRAPLVDVGDDEDGIPSWVPARVPAGYSRSELYMACEFVAGLVWPSTSTSIAPSTGGSSILRPFLRLWKRWDYAALPGVLKDLEAWIVASRTCGAIPFRIARGQRLEWYARESRKTWQAMYPDTTSPELVRPGRLLSHMRILPSRLELAHKHARGECGCCTGQPDAGGAPVPGDALRWALEGLEVDGAELDPAGLWTRTAARVGLELGVDVDVEALEVLVEGGALVVQLARPDGLDALIEALQALLPAPPFALAFRGR